MPHSKNRAKNTTLISTLPHPSEKNTANTADKKSEIGTRQLCFFFAFLVPVSKLLEAPSVLAYYAKGDLLFPALCHFLLQSFAIALLLFCAARSDKSFFERVEDRLGTLAAKITYFFLAAYFLFYSLLPLLEFERYVYTAFFDAAPPFSAFLPFFIFSAYVCTKGLRSFARSADLAFPLFLVSFVGLVAMSLPTADLTAVLPLFGTPVSSSLKGAARTFIHFSDSALFLPMLGSYRYKKGDGKKVLGSYWLGALAVLLFLAVFYGIFGPLSPIKTFAFDKTAQYFKPLATIGRIDLLFAYLITVLLLFYYALPLQLSTHCICRALPKTALPLPKNRTLPTAVFVSAAINLLLLLATLFLTERYTKLYALITYRLFPVFPFVAYLLPLFCLFVTIQYTKNKSKTDQKINQKTK